MARTLGSRKWRFRAAILAFTLLSVLSTIWASQAESAPETRASSKSGVAKIQLLGVNDFHGNLEAIANPTYSTPTGIVERKIACRGPAGGRPTSTPTWTETRPATPTAPSGCTLETW